MREILFRVWDKVDYLSSPFTLQDLQTDKISFTSDCIVEQYTGLKDKHGKKIFEGDVVIYPHTTCDNATYKDTYSVIYKAPEFKLKAIVSHVFKSGAEIYLNDTVEVIGNIHTNN